MGRAVSPNSGLVHWVSMMTDHHGHHGHHMPAPAHSGSHESVHYSMWNGGLDVSIKFRSLRQSVAFFISCFISCQVYFAPLSWFYDFRQCILSPKSVFCWSPPSRFPSFLPSCFSPCLRIIYHLVNGLRVWFRSRLFFYLLTCYNLCFFLLREEREKRLKWESQSWWSCWSSLHENDDDDFGHEVEGRLMHHKKEKCNRNNWYFFSWMLIFDPFSLHSNFLPPHSLLSFFLSTTGQNDGESSCINER